MDTWNTGVSIPPVTFIPAYTELTTCTCAAHTFRTAVSLRGDDDVAYPVTMERLLFRLFFVSVMLPACYRCLFVDTTYVQLRNPDFFTLIAVRLC